MSARLVFCSHLLLAVLALSACSTSDTADPADVGPGDTGLDIMTGDGSGPSRDVVADVGGGASGAVDLFESRHWLLSRRGAHAYLAYAPGEGRGPELYWRQQGDLLSHFGMFTPLLAPAVELEAGACEEMSYAWRGHAVERELRCGAVELRETAYFAAPGAVELRYRVLSSDDTSATLSLGGGVGTPSVRRQAEAAADDPCGLALELETDVAAVGGPTSQEHWSMRVQGDGCAARSLDTATGDWSLDFAADAGAEWTLQLVWSQEGAPDLVGAPDAHSALVAELDGWMAAAPPDAELDDPMAALSWFLLWENTAAPHGNWTHEAVTPSKRHYFRAVWLWDAAFNALALARGGADARALGAAQADIFLGQPAEDGHLHREIWVDAIPDGVQAPAMMTWAVLALHDAAAEDAGPGDAALAARYPALAANHRWFVANRDSDGDGLFEWSGLDSGWDTSPRWDGGDVEAVDLLSWLYLDAVLLAEIAGRLELPTDAADWQAEADQHAAALRERFFDDEDGLFYDLTIDDGEPVRVPTPAAFVPLFVGAATQAQAEAVAAHLDTTLAAPYPLPTVSPSSPDYDPQDYWRGPSWIVTNAFAVWGLERYGLQADADHLRAATLSMIAANPTTHEYYDSQTGEALGAPDFMWTGVFYLLLSGDSPVVW